MASVSPESAWEFAEAIKSVVGKPTTKRRATVQSVDKDGTIWVQLPGSANTTPIASTGANVSPGDTVLTELRGTSLHITENNTDPAIGTRQASDIARQAAKPAVDAAKAARGIAAEAQAVANATNQHFWDDDNGAHVTDVTKDEWTAAAADDFSDLSDAKPYHNLLMNSLGILLRRALNNLVSISRSAIAFFDGLGNNASNIVARFGSAGAQIGKSDESHMELDYHSLKMVDKEGNAYLYVSDLRGNDGFYRYSVSHTGDGTTTTYSFNITTLNIGATYIVESVKIDGEPTSAYTHPWGTAITFDTAPALNAEIVIDVACDSPYLKAFTLGRREAESDVGAFSFAFGVGGVASGDRSFAFGPSEATGVISFAFGLSTASSAYSFAEGVHTVASAMYSHAQNHGTVASSISQTAMGKYNEEDANGTYALIVGNGTSDTARSNAHTLDWQGNAVYAGDVTDGTGNVLSDKLDASTAASTYLPKTALTVDTYTQAYTAAANSLSGAITIDVSKTGYTPLGIVGFACGAGGAAIEQASISGTTATLYIRNVTSSAISRDCTINVLYVAVV